VQPTRAQFVAQRGELKSVPPVAVVLNHHFNAITSWGVEGSGEVKHVYA
jgi:sulfane dehydrogenase subunit SoxC